MSGAVIRYLQAWKRMVALGVVALGTQGTAAAQGNDGPASDTASDRSVGLEERVEQLDQQIRVLKRLMELARDSSVAANRSLPGVTASRDGFNLRSADGRYTIRFRGYFQSDGRFVPSTGVVGTTDNFLIRRARPILEATVGKYFGFRLMPDFGGAAPAIFDAYWEAVFVPQFGIRAGKFKPPIGFERLQSASDITFAERGLPTNLAPSRDIGLQVGGDVAAGVFSYQVGVFNGVPDLANGGDDPSSAKDLAGRIFVQPFLGKRLSGLGLGIAASTGVERGTTAAPALPGYRTPGQATFFKYRTDATTPANTVFANGDRTRVAPQGYLYAGPLGLLGEYTVTWQAVTRGTTTATLQHAAWQASGSFFLTGEKEAFRSPAPRKPFDLGQHGFGAVELVARYGEIRIDPAAFPLYANPAASAQKAKAWGVGLNWHFTRAVKFVVDYEHTTFAGGVATGNLASENVLVTRFQHSF